MIPSNIANVPKKRVTSEAANALSGFLYRYFRV